MFKKEKIKQMKKLELSKKNSSSVSRFYKIIKTLNLLKNLKINLNLNFILFHDFNNEFRTHCRYQHMARRF